MDSLVFTVTILIFSLLMVLVSFRKKKYNLPPGPPVWPIVGNLPDLKFSKLPFHEYVKKLRQKYGPIFTIRMGSHSIIMVAGPELLHEALVEKGSAFADRPAAQGVRKLFSSNQMSINAAAYGPVWRALRRNMVNETLNPSKIKSFWRAREWGMEVMMKGIREEANQNGGVVSVSEHMRFAMFCILAFICFGVRLDDATARHLRTVLTDVLRTGGGMDLDDAFPILGVFYRKRWQRMQEVREVQIQTLMPLINKRRSALENGAASMEGYFRSYVDSLFTMRLEDGRPLCDNDLVTLCAEFMIAGTDTTFSCLQWLMCNLVTQQHIQDKIYDEIVRVVGHGRPVNEDDILKMPYLEAAVKETFRRHSPGNFLLWHAVTAPAKLGGYDIPPDAFINFFITDVALDANVWENPMEFIPERFLNKDVDMTGGSKDIRMLPFGAGRRICPGMAVATFHMQLVVSRLLQEYKWECKPNEKVDWSEMQEFTTIMKNPLKTLITKRV